MLALSRTRPALVTSREFCSTRMAIIVLWDSVCAVATKPSSFAAAAKARNHLSDVGAAVGAFDCEVGLIVGLDVIGAAVVGVIVGTAVVGTAVGALDGGAAQRRKPPIAAHSFVTQSMLRVHRWPRRQGLHCGPPQSTSVSRAPWIPSLHPGVVGGLVGALVGDGLGRNVGGNDGKPVGTFVGKGLG